MKIQLKNIFLSLIFCGFIMSCFENTILHIAKKYKLSEIEFSNEIADFNDDNDNDNDNNEENKIDKIYEDFSLPEFNYSFLKNVIVKANHTFKQLQIEDKPLLLIITPPPRV